MLLTSQSEIAGETDFSYAKYNLKGLNCAALMDLLSNQNKSKDKLNSELLALWSSSMGDKTIPRSVKTSDLYGHEFFELLGGNPLCTLLVSSLISESTVSEVYEKLKDMKSKANKEGLSQSSDMTFKLSIHISLDYINSKNPQLFEALKCLAFCPSGLTRRDLLKMTKEWDEWVELLKDRSLIKEKQVLADFTLANDSPWLKMSRVDTSEREKMYVMDSSLAEFIEESMTPREKEEYDLKAVNLMVSMLKEILIAGKDKFEELALHEENIWVALTRLENKALEGNTYNFWGTMYSKGKTFLKKGTESSYKQQETNVIENTLMPSAINMIKNQTMKRLITNVHKENQIFEK